MLKPKKATKLDLTDYFNTPVSPRQKQYEAIRAIVVENASIDTVAKKYGYKSSTIYSLLRDAKAGRINLFPAIAKGPEKKQTSPAVQNRIIALRKQEPSTPDIHQRLLEEGITSSISTVERILKAAGFDKLPRRTNKELGKSTTQKEIPERVALLDFSTLEPFDVDTPCVGVFFFLPYILESNIVDILKRCQLPSSPDINAVSACLSMLLLKLIGCQKTFRQIAVKDHGRSKPTFILTNNWDLPLKDILEVYAKRWRVENKLAEIIAFFNMNALSSPIMIRIHFDILWTIIADTLYHRFAQDL